MIWMIVGAGVLLIIGSIMMLKPSARDTRLAALRFDAIKQGLQVRQFVWQPDPKKTGIQEPLQATSYSLMRPGQAQPGELKYSLVASKGWDTDGLPAGFSWHKQGSAEDAARLAALLPALQDDLLLLEVREHKILLMAKERQGASAAAYREFMQGFF